MNSWLLILIILGHLGVLFSIAFWAEKNVKSPWVNNPYLYALSLGVYCSAWTYYGSVGVAAKTGIDFLTIYLGPVIALPLWILIMRRVIRIAKSYKIASIADFISLRYGNSRSLGAFVAILCVLGILPYISLQLKAVSETFELMTTDYEKAENIFQDTTFYIALLLAIFVAFFGTLATDASQRRRGIMSTVAIESIIKLIFFLIIGIYVCTFLFDGTTDIYHQASKLPDFERLTTLNGLDHGINWLYMIALSFFAIFLLPRQFHVAVIENENPKYLKKAIWMFSLYLLLFNVFVFFIAFGGKLLLGDTVNADYYSLLLPLSQHNTALSLMVFIGGFSAVISMVVVSSLSLSNMLTNNLLIPYGLLDRHFKTNPEQNTNYIRIARRFCIFLLIVGAYFFYYYFSDELPLFSIGLISFVVIAQLAPPFFLGLFWNRGTALASKIGITIGFCIVAYTLIIPRSLCNISENIFFIDHGLHGYAWLKPYALFGLDILSPEAHALFWSLLFNTISYLVFSLIRTADYRERNYGELFVNIDSFGALHEEAFVWKGEAFVEDIKKVLYRFLGVKKTDRALRLFYAKYNLNPKEKKVDARFINYSEKLLTGTLGSASARILIANVSKEQYISMTEVLRILEETKNARATNKALKEKSKELSMLTTQLQNANQELIAQDRLKDEFLDTVAHELKTPITSIKAASEVLLDDLENMPKAFRLQFLNNIQEDANRLQRLITSILDLEKLASGRHQLELKSNLINRTIDKAIKGIQQLAEKKKVTLLVRKSEQIDARYDEDRMHQVLTNLLSNALKFTEEEKGKIELSVKEEDQMIKVVIEDNGKGIPKEDFNYIFEKFYQSKDQNIKKPQGSGFGLAICKKIIESHKGKIWADPTYQKGARFVFVIPK